MVHCQWNPRLPNGSLPTTRRPLCMRYSLRQKSTAYLFFLVMIIGIMCGGRTLWISWRRSIQIAADKERERNSCLELAQQCPEDVPHFVTFGFTHVGRWSAEELVKGTQFMYSSLVKAHQCTPLMYVYSNDPDALNNKLLRTTMNTETNIKVISRAVSAIDGHGYAAKWQALSSYKLDIMELHLKRNENVVWIDTDTLVFTDLRSVTTVASSWVVGWEHGRHFEAEHRVIAGVPVPPEFEALGDLWTIDLETIQELRELETTQSRKPMYDLQGYFSILMTQGSTRIDLLQRLMPGRSFGFQCSNWAHPNDENFQPIILENELHCKDRQGIEMSPSRVGAISFTANTFKTMMIQKGMLPNQDPKVASWFHRHFETCSVNK